MSATILRRTEIWGTITAIVPHEDTVHAVSATFLSEAEQLTRHWAQLTESQASLLDTLKEAGYREIETNDLTKIQRSFFGI